MQKRHSTGQSSTWSGCPVAQYNGTVTAAIAKAEKTEIVVDAQDNYQ